MIIPVKCFTCGKVLANKYQYFKRTTKERKGTEDKNVYLTMENMNKSIEGVVLDEIGIKKMCCRRHMLTHVDVI